MSSMSLPRNLIQTDWFREVAPTTGQLHDRGLPQPSDHRLDGEALALGFGCALGILVIGLYFASTGLKERMART